MTDAVVEASSGGFDRVAAEPGEHPAVPAIADPAAPGELHRVEFHGNAREYFGIWIVNTALTLLTLGLYAPWAKVRRNRYFSANTTVLGHSFDYHATGGQLLKGWLIVAVYLVGYNLIADTYPIAALVIAVGVMIALPWLVDRALRFKARVTSYRNVRFQFIGRLSQAYVSILLGGILSLVSLGLLAPVFSRVYQRYLLAGLRFGDHGFETRGRLWSLYKSIWLPAIILLIGVLPALVVASLVVNNEYRFTPEALWTREWLRMIFHVIFSYFAAIPFLLAYFFMLIIYRTGVRNVMWSAASYDGKHRLLSDVPRLRYAWILLTNTLATILSLGLLRPWAAVRERSFLVSHTGIWIVGSLDDVQSVLATGGNAFSSEFLDSDGFDFGF